MRALGRPGGAPPGCCGGHAGRPAAAARRGPGWKRRRAVVAAAPVATGPGNGSASRLEAQVAVVLGTQWGDEGKGKLVDILARQYDIVARAQAAPAAPSAHVLRGREVGDWGCHKSVQAA